MLTYIEKQNQKKLLPAIRDASNPLPESCFSATFCPFPAFLCWLHSYFASPLWDTPDFFLYLSQALEKKDYIRNMTEMRAVQKSSNSASQCPMKLLGTVLYGPSCTLIQNYLTGVREVFLLTYHFSLDLSCTYGYNCWPRGQVWSILPPSLPRLFSPHWTVNSGWGQKLYTLFKQSTKAAVHWVILRSVWELRGTLFISFVLVSVNSAVWGKAYCAGQCFLLT